MRTVSRAAILLLATTAASLSAAPAFAGQAYSAPGFPSGSSSCVGAAMSFQAHYGGEDSTFPEITHGTVGSTMSGHATSDTPGAVGDFESTLAHSSGPIWVCLP
jgi:hypothetical protein